MTSACYRLCAFPKLEILMSLLGCVNSGPDIKEVFFSMNICSCIHENSRPINRKKGKATNPNNSLFSEKKSSLVGSNQSYTKAV